MEPGVNFPHCGWFFENKAKKPGAPDQPGSDSKPAKPDPGIGGPESFEDIFNGMGAFQQSG
jgi:hypothetical protein